jgi:putative PIN family toxin of toxin-antitoxin system
MIKSILDTNVILSASFSAFSTPAKAVDKATIAKNRAFISNEIFAELSEVIQRPKFDKYVPIEKRLKFLEKVKNEFIFHEVTHEIQLCRDSKDDKFLSLAAACNADFLITGDQDLLILHPFQNTQIVTPSDFLSL